MKQIVRLRGRRCFAQWDFRPRFDRQELDYKAAVAHYISTIVWLQSFFLCELCSILKKFNYWYCNVLLTNEKFDKDDEFTFFKCLTPNKIETNENFFRNKVIHRHVTCKARSRLHDILGAILRQIFWPSCSMFLRIFKAYFFLQLSMEQLLF